MMMMKKDREALVDESLTPIFCTSVVVFVIRSIITIIIVTVYAAIQEITALKDDIVKHGDSCGFFEVTSRWIEVHSSKHFKACSF